MSLKTSIQNLRTDIAVRKASIDAAIQIQSTQLRRTPMFGVVFALGFMFMLMALAVPASAATLNGSIGPVLDSVIELFVPLLALVTAAVPLIIVMSIISFVLGILAAILGKLHV